MATMASQYRPSIPHHSDPDTISVSSELDTTHPTHHHQHTSSTPSPAVTAVTAAAPAAPAAAPAAPASVTASASTSSIELDDELDSFLDDHHRFPDYHDHPHHAARYSVTDSPVVSGTPSQPRRSRFDTLESNASTTTSIYSSRSSHPPRTSSLSHSSPSVPPLFASTARTSASPIKRKPLSASASSLATAFQRSSTASSTVAGSVVNTPDVPPLPHAASGATTAAVTPAPVTAHSLQSLDVSQEATRPPTAVSSHSAGLPEPDTRFARPPSVDSPTLYNFPPTTSIERLPAAFHAISQSQDALSTRSIQEIEQDASSAHSVQEVEQDDFSDVLSIYQGATSAPTPDASTPATHANPLTRHDSYHSVVGKSSVSTRTDSSTLMFAPKPTPPHLNLDTADKSPPDVSDHSPDHTRSHSDSPTSAPKLNKPLPKSPGGQVSPFSALFSWGNGSNIQSGADFSPIPSPETPTRRGGLLDDPARPPPSTSLPRDQKTNAVVANPLGYCETQLSTPPPLAASSYIQLEEMEDELKAISSELAASIRREIDLEDLVDRLQEQTNNAQAAGKRTSDYFSDSGYSSAKLSDYDQSREEIEKIQRRSEQEKASIRLELTNKLQDERQKIKTLDQQVKELAERASRIDLAEMNNMDANGRLKELENTCEQLRRKLVEERSSKTNIEDLLTALKGELSSACSERDNLRDEVVPQLRARVEGLEAEAASYASLTYESTKMQHQLQSLQKENSSLRDSAAGLEDIASRGGLSRSDSFFRNQKPPVSRSDSVANKSAPAESREALAERLKDVEAQRDALHSALKNLLERQEFQNRENQKKIKILETERQRLLSDSPHKAGFEKDISILRAEVNVLRRRAEEAMEQKWQVEKGLGGLKMDLDRAEEEVASLRSMLKEKDILTARTASSSAGATVTSEELEDAYKALQAEYNESLERIKKLENGLPGDEKTKQALQRLESSLNAALSERDVARGDASGLQSQYDELASSTAKSMDSERALADELGESAVRVEQLASQVRAQLATNFELRQRLSDAVARSEADRKSNSDRIAGLQERLHSLEDQLVTAQTSSDERVAHHEEEVSKLKDAHNEQLRRLQEGGGVGITGPRKGSLLSPVNTMFNRAANALPPKNLEEAVEIQKLRARVAELEKALADADTEMQEVINKMSTAQIEVMNLQEEREAAVRETRRLQGMLKQEQVSPFADRLRALGVSA
ncbi:intracellular protein transport-like protein [Cordyceps javanica]|uniref:Intracellular protein transport-like protein n=1 Tax=Cordyceps javanica TaxID=43265 RepID=A0A545V9Q4_9HYPO|nr:intracellular protein transport-like protein [Cordyceps javanica]TQW09664.1 intracellular protein transport-like protein [Cordyceps javanica]